MNIEGMKRDEHGGAVTLIILNISLLSEIQEKLY